MKHLNTMTKKAFIGSLLWAACAFAYTNSDSESRIYPFYTGENVVLRIPEEIAMNMDNGFYCLPHGVKNSSYEVETTFDGGGQPYKFKVNQCQNFYDPNDPQYGCVALNRNLDKNGKANKVYISNQGATLWQNRMKTEQRSVAA